MKKKNLLVLGAILAVATLSGCKDIFEGKTVVNFWHTMGQTNQGTLSRMITEFEKENPEIKILHSMRAGAYDGIFSDIKYAISGNNLPAMAYCYPDHVATYLKSDVVTDINTFLDNPDLAFTEEEGGVEDFIESYWEEGRVYDIEGMYSAPFSKSTEVMFANQTYLSTNAVKQLLGADFDPNKIVVWENEADPTDYTALINVARKLKANDPNLRPIGYDSDANMLITMMEQLGIPYTSADPTIPDGERFLFDNPEAKALVAKIQGWYDEGLLLTQGTNLGANTSRLLLTQELIFSIGSSGGTTYNWSGSFETMPIKVPQLTKDKTSLLSQGPSIVFFNRATQAQQEAAWKFYKFITNAKNSATYAMLTGYEPVRHSSYDTDAYKIFLEGKDPSGLPLAGADLLRSRTANLTKTLSDYYFTSPAFGGSAVARIEMNGLLASVLLKQATIPQAFTKALTNCRFSVIGG